ncbi:MAG: FHA domain-containing protein [Gammaproteobacteria bacterium]|nr:FHA domain-containing protein [Gammaproteobacteria bacterium]
MNDTSRLASLEGRSFIIGREGHIYLNHPAISKHHAEISVRQGRVFLRDMNSSNGIFLLRGTRLVPFQEGIVQLDQPVVFGKKIKTPRELLSIAVAFDD